MLVQLCVFKGMRTLSDTVIYVFVLVCLNMCGGHVVSECWSATMEKGPYVSYGHNSCYATGSNDHSNIQSQPTVLLFSINWCRHVEVAPPPALSSSPTLSPWRQHINTGLTSMQQGCKFSVVAAPGGPIHGCTGSSRRIHRTLSDNCLHLSCTNTLHISGKENFGWCQEKIRSRDSRGCWRDDMKGLDINSQRPAPHSPYSSRVCWYLEHHRVKVKLYQAPDELRVEQWQRRKWDRGLLMEKVVNRAAGGCMRVDTMKVCGRKQDACLT